MNITLQTAAGTHELIGKVYAGDRVDVYRTMAAISQAGFGPEAEFSIPKPLAFIPTLRLLLLEKAQGPLATETFLKGDERACVEAARRCAGWLAHFHRHAPVSGPVSTPTHELLEHWVHRLAKRAGRQSGRLVDTAVLLFARLESVAKTLDHIGTCACHGTYCYYQIIFTESRTVVLDWDGFCVTHPSIDIARFIVVLQQLALKSRGSLNALDPAVEAFYRTYAAASSFEVAKHLPFYKAAHCLKHAKHHLKPGNGGIEMAEIILDEGLRILTEER
jgi:hypothetical protein